MFILHITKITTPHEEGKDSKVKITARFLNKCVLMNERRKWSNTGIFLIQELLQCSNLDKSQVSWRRQVWSKLVAQFIFSLMLF
jgi:hypothetical protein